MKISPKSFTIEDYLDFLISHNIKFRPSNYRHPYFWKVYYQLEGWFGSSPSTIRLCLIRTTKNGGVDDPWSSKEHVNADYNFLKSIDYIHEPAILEPVKVFETA